MKNSHSIYLSKDGAQFGPFTEEQIHEFRNSGEIKKYDYLWRPGSPAWEPLAPPPPPPLAETSSVTHLPVKPKLKLLPGTPLHAICHDHRRMLTGKIADISEKGCIFQVESRDSSPGFSKRAPVVLNLLDSLSGKSMNVSAQVVQAFRQESRWHYQLQWQELPEIIAIA